MTFFSIFADLLPASTSQVYINFMAGVVIRRSFALGILRFVLATSRARRPGGVNSVVFLCSIVRPLPLLARAGGLAGGGATLATHPPDVVRRHSVVLRSRIFVRSSYSNVISEPVSTRASQLWSASSKLLKSAIIIRIRCPAVSERNTQSGAEHPLTMVLPYELLAAAS